MMYKCPECKNYYELKKESGIQFCPYCKALEDEHKYNKLKQEEQEGEMWANLRKPEYYL